MRMDSFPVLTEISGAPFPHQPETANSPTTRLLGCWTGIKKNPMSRRHVVSAWYPCNAQTSTLPPCHAFWALNVQTTKEEEPILCLHLTQRSADVALGVPYNIAGYAFHT